MFLQPFWTSFQSLYLAHPGYLITNLVFTILLHVFISIILLVLSEKEDRKRYSYTSSNATIKFLLRSPILLVRSVLQLICKLHLLALLDFKHLKSKEGLHSEYILFHLLAGLIISVIILAFVEIMYAVSMVLYIVWAFLLLIYITGLGQVRRLDHKKEPKFQIGHNKGVIYLKTAGETRKLEGRMSLLGISLHAGMIGIITTIGAGILEAPLTFTLIPVTFDMLSVTSALLEFPGLRVILPTIEDLEKLKVTLFAILISIGVSIFLTTIVWMVNPAHASAFSNTLISVFWAMIAVLVSIVTYSPTK